MLVFNRTMTYSFPSAAAILIMLVIQKSSSSYERIKNAKVHRAINEPKQTGDSALVQSKLTKTIYINSIRIINKYTILSEQFSERL